MGVSSRILPQGATLVIQAREKRLELRPTPEEAGHLVAIASTNKNDVGFSSGAFVAHEPMYGSSPDKDELLLGNKTIRTPDDPDLMIVYVPLVCTIEIEVWSAKDISFPAGLAGRVHDERED